ncbi:MAG: hypothetical protein ACRC10_00820 [Thermoguttaceae bacterium]
MYELSPEEAVRVDAALKRIEAGIWVEHEDMRKETRKWLLSLEKGLNVIHKDQEYVAKH